MLQDPENFEEITIEVKASSEKQAVSIAENIALQNSESETIVVCIGCKRRTKTTGKFLCILRIESKGNHDDS